MFTNGNQKRIVNFRVGFEVEHGGILNYAYIIKFLADNRFLFFATDLEYKEEKLKPIIKRLKQYKVSNYLVECNYNDYLYHLAEKEQRIGCDRHFSDYDLIRFIKKVNPHDPKIITIHGSNRLSADSYTKKMIIKKYLMPQWQSVLVQKMELKIYLNYEIMKVTILKKSIKEGVSARTGSEYKIRNLFVKFDDEKVYNGIVNHLKKKRCYN